MNIFLLSYMLCNIWTFLLIGSDKRRAINKRYRIKEKTLLLSGVFGPFGALIGMYTFHHKTRKWYFRWTYSAMIVVHVLLYFYLQGAIINGINEII